jgi:hypothetical protein
MPNAQCLIFTEENTEKDKTISYSIPLPSLKLTGNGREFKTFFYIKSKMKGKI